MTVNRDLDTIVSAWLDEGPVDLPDATRRAILTSLPTTRQARRGLFAPRRIFDMNGFGRLAAVALVAVIAVGGAIYLIGPRLGVGTASPTPLVSPTPALPTAVTPTTAPTPGDSVALLSYTSAAYGYTVDYAQTWTVVPASGTWPPGGVIDPSQAYVDRFSPLGSPVGVFVGIAGQPLPDGSTALEWMTAWATEREARGGPCVGPASAWVDATVSGVAARRIEAPCSPEVGAPTNFVEYAWVIDDTGYVITGSPVSAVEAMVASFQAP